MRGKRLTEMEAWYAGVSLLTPSLPRIRRFLLWKLGPVCSECGWAGKNPFTNTFVIELDHIDGDHLNSSPANFRLLCPNCHAMTPTYKSLNRETAKDSFGLCRVPVDEVW